MVKYCRRCGKRFTEYLNESRKECIDCLVKNVRRVNYKIVYPTTSSDKIKEKEFIKEEEMEI